MSPSRPCGGHKPNLPKPGEVVTLDQTASVQFAGANSCRFRVTHIDDRSTYAGWVWLCGYVLDRHGRAIARREVFVQIAGLQRHQLHPKEQAA